MHPIFVRLRHRLDKAKQELAQIDAAEQLLATLPATETTCWLRRTSLAVGIESVYSEIENMLKAIAVEIDGYYLLRSCRFPLILGVKPHQWHW